MKYFTNLLNALLGKQYTVVKVVEEVRVVEVLSQGAYDRLARGLEQPLITSTDTAMSTGFKLGIQRALEQVRQKFSH